MADADAAIDDLFDEEIGIRAFGERYGGFVDEEIGLVKKKVGLQGIIREDPELAAYGGKYTTKYQILQVTIRLPERNPLALIAILYGFAMYAIPALMLAGYFLIPDAFILLYGLAMLLVTVIINEAILKPHYSEPRPPESANLLPDGSSKPGMPSGHAANAYALLVWAIFEVIDHQLQRSLWIPLLLICLAPVPWSRWYNRDHTAWQCIAGAMVGSALGVIYAFQRSMFFS